jgi:hypothetical protein
MLKIIFSILSLIISIGVSAIIEMYVSNPAPFTWFIGLLVGFGIGTARPFDNGE